MTRLIFAVIMLICIMSMNAQNQINMTIGTTTVTVDLDDNDATASLIGKLQTGQVTVTTTRYGGFEQVGSLPWSLPTSNQQITTQPGDVILYNGSQLVVFFGTNTWNYTRLGRIRGLGQSQLYTLLNVPDCNMILSLPSTTGVHHVQSEVLQLGEPMYNLSGQRVMDNYRGIVVQNGRKIKKR
jgi:hypothetical protein